MTKKSSQPLSVFLFVSHIFFSYIRFHKFLKQFIAKCNEYNQSNGTYTSIRIKIYEILETFISFLFLCVLLLRLLWFLRLKAPWSSCEKKNRLKQQSSIVST